YGGHALRSRLYHRAGIRHAANGRRGHWYRPSGHVVYQSAFHTRCIAVSPHASAAGLRTQMSAPQVQLEASWHALLKEEFEQEYMQALRAFLRAELQAGKRIHPPGKLIFNALNSTP